ncbi:flavodoxin [Clostridium sp. MCC353]|uniref:flavodoxin n=1 Tax=Clostridium sp. MCC353 TaxID=2592646 RepID=UPI001C0307EC|nr:flavodoxin [Clostridium sp. MCC353]MBT9779647.1 flavodoxin [Clostridium sp. MCC353]
MKRWKQRLLAAAAAAILAGCGAAQNQPEAEVEPLQTKLVEAAQTKAAQVDSAQKSLARTETAKADSPQTKTKGENILIAYFTWADNTHVENPDSVDVDATTSASVLPPGNAALMADWIRQEVGGDLFSIKVEEPYSSDYDECLNRAADEKADRARPALSTHVDNMEDYDIVFLGFPNWWYTLPMPVLSFVEEYDFSGKTVVPFCTHGTGGLAATIQDLKKALPESARVLDPIGVYRPEVKDAQPEIQEWLDGLDL